MTIKVAINGLGRIGKCAVRAIYENYSQDIELVAVNAPGNVASHAHLLNYDSVHGKANFKATANEKNLIINGKEISTQNSREIMDLKWDVDYVLECSGQFNKASIALKHIDNGAKKVIVSAPCEAADATIVYGVNNKTLANVHKVISVGSCTTNALSPIAKILNDSIGIESGFMTTIHAYTNDQKILDGTHKDLRRARACNLSMIPTSTGAAKTIGLIIPELAGKLNGSSIRVPTPNVSMIDFTFIAKRKTNNSELNEIIKTAAENNFKNIVLYCDEPLVSIDFNHNTHSAIFDSLETQVVNGNFCRVVAWYDNEWGFTNRMLDVLKLIALGN